MRNSTRTTPQRECNDYLTAVSRPVRILPDSRRIVTTSSNTQVVGNRPIAPRSLEVTLQNAATPIPRTHGEDRFDGKTNRPLSLERPASGPLPTRSASSAKLENIMRKRISSIPALAEDTVVCFLKMPAKPRNQAEKQS